MSNVPIAKRNDHLRRATVAQHADALPAEVDVVSPAGRMEHLSLERLDTLQLWDAGHDQHADGRHDGRRVRELLLLARSAHVARLDTPHIRVCIPLGPVDGRVKAAVGAEAVFVEDAVHIVQNFGLRAVPAIPVRFWVRGEGVVVDGNVGATSLDEV
jgi:hypothetical protein